MSNAKDFDLRLAMKKANEEYERSREAFKQKRVVDSINNYSNWASEQKLRIGEREFDFIAPSNKPKEKSILFKKQNGFCALCKLPMTMKQATIDHILPKSKGGSNDISNKQLAHGICNNAKGDSTEILRVAQYQDIYHARKDLISGRHKRKSERKKVSGR